MSGQVRAIATILVCALASTAAAQPSEAVKKADALFQEGRRLLDSGDAAAACPKFEESQRLDPGLGTLLNLADCYERTGRLASALTAFRSAEEQARGLGEKKREVAAADRARALESRVSRVTITLAPGDRPAGFEVRRNGAAVPALDVGRSIAVDPGTITIEAMAPGFTTFREVVDVATARSNQQVDIPVLTPTTAGPPPDDHTPIDVPSPPRPTAAVDPGAGRRRLGLVVGGVGVAGLGAGIAIGLVAKGRYADAGCDGGVCATSADLDAANDARSLGTVGTIVGGVGAVAIAAGAVLWLTAPKARSLEVAPTASADGAGVVVVGRF
ncbi:MAG: hypothetical protein IPH80_16610 [Myxococcales bacterium]|nr:hypothetical protein [Myxococcales bacterium]